MQCDCAAAGMSFFIMDAYRDERNTEHSEIIGVIGCDNDLKVKKIDNCKFFCCNLSELHIDNLAENGRIII